MSIWGTRPDRLFKFRVVAVASLLAACQGPATNVASGVDAGQGTTVSDASVVDAPVFDAGIFDAGIFDAGISDALVPDTLVPDAPWGVDAISPVDAAPTVDSSPLPPVDAGSPDASVSCAPPPASVTANGGYFDVVLDTERDRLFLSYRAEGSVVALDLDDGTAATLNTGWLPEHMAFDPVRNEVVVALPVADHSLSWHEDAQEGYVAVIDATAPSDPIPIWVPRDPGQIVTDGYGVAYVAGGSGQWTHLVSIQVDTAVPRIFSGSSVWNGSGIAMHPDRRRLYSIATRDFNDIARWNVSGGVGTHAYDMADNTHDAFDDLRIHPGGAAIFTSCGNVFGIGTTAADDMLWTGSLDSAWLDLAFDPTGSFVFTIPEGADEIRAYDATTLQPVATLAVGAGNRRLLTGCSYVLAVRDVATMGRVEARADVLPYHALALDVQTGCNSRVAVTTPAQDCGGRCAYLHSAGTSVTLTAAPSTSETFTGWAGDCSGTAPCTVSMDRAHRVTATFVAPAEDLVVSIVGPGTGRVAAGRGQIDCGSLCSAPVVSGCPVELTATPGPTSVFQGWSGDCSGTATCELLMEMGKSVTASFEWIANVLHLWSFSPAGTDSEEATAVATFADGAVVVVGQFYGDLYLGSVPIVSDGGTDAFVAKYSADGAHQWSAKIGSWLNDTAFDVAVDGSGNVFVAGYFQTSITFAGQVHTVRSWADYFVAKYSVTGDELWFRSFGGSGHEDENLRLAVDGTGDVVVTGVFRTPLDFGPGAVAPNDGTNHDIFIVKYAGTDGAYRWASQMGPQGGARTAIPVAVDASDNIFIASHFVSELDLGSGPPLIAVFGQDAFIAKLSLDGENVLASRGIGGANSDDQITELVLDGQSPVVFGAFDGTVDFGGGDVVIATPTPFVARYSGADLSYVAAKVVPGAGVRRAAVDHAGRLRLVGGFWNTVDFGTGPIVSTGRTDGFLLSLDSADSTDWIVTFGGPGSDWASDVAIDPSGNIIVVGSFGESIQMGGAPLVANGTNIFIAKYAP